MHTHIVKRREGHKEPYDNHKVYASCYAASLNANLKKEEAETLCEKVTATIDAWVDEKDVLTSEEIFEQVIHVLETYNGKVAFLYKTHRDVS